MRTHLALRISVTVELPLTGTALFDVACRRVQRLVPLQPRNRQAADEHPQNFGPCQGVERQNGHEALVGHGRQMLQNVLCNLQADEVGCREVVGRLSVAQVRLELVPRPSWQVQGLSEHLQKGPHKEHVVQRRGFDHARRQRRHVHRYGCSSDHVIAWNAWLAHGHVAWSTHGHGRCQTCDIQGALVPRLLQVLLLQHLLLLELQLQLLLLLHMLLLQVLLDLLLGKQGCRLGAHTQQRVRRPLRHHRHERRRTVDCHEVGGQECLGFQQARACRSKHRQT